jgi:hypothetical protein
MASRQRRHEDYPGAAPELIGPAIGGQTANAAQLRPITVARYLARELIAPFASPEQQQDTFRGANDELRKNRAQRPYQRQGRNTDSPNGQESIMKLNSSQTEQALSQFEAEVLPDDHPALTQLSDIYGDHTFFLDGSGLNVLEPAEAVDTEAHTGEIVNLASWSDATLTSLRPHDPEPTGILVVLERTH